MYAIGQQKYDDDSVIDASDLDSLYFGGGTRGTVEGALVSSTLTIPRSSTSYGSIK